MDPEFSSINDLASALLIPSSLPVSINVLLLNNPSVFCIFASSTVRIFSSSFKTLYLYYLEKNSLLN